MDEPLIKISVYILTGLIGLCVGSFLNVVVYRLPQGMSVATPASHCPNCNYFLKWYDNIPVFSYIFLGGKCRKCRAPISPRYMIVELTNMLLWLACLTVFYKVSLLFAAISAVACSVFVCVFFIDLEHMIIPDRFQIILLVLGVASFFANDGIPYWERLIGGGGGFLLFLGFYFLGMWIFKREALGGGDIKLVATCGLILGYKKLFLAILIGSLTASIVLLILSSRKAKNEQLSDNESNSDSPSLPVDQREYPFAPFLTVGMVVSLLLGQFIIDWYVNLF